MDLRHNPFYILGASLTDNKRRIMELAEEKSLFGNEEAIEEAKTILLDPIRRIDAELSWFPELDVETARAMALYLVEGTTMPSCRLNGMGRITGKAEIMSHTQYDALSNKDMLANDILMLSRAFRYLDNDALLDLLNQKRRRSGLSEILDEYLFADKIDNRRKEVLEIIHHCMDSISIEILLQMFYRIAEQDTEDGNIQASILVEDIVRSYENNMMTQEFMENEVNVIRGLLVSIEQAIKNSNNRISEYVLKLVQALENELQKWQKVVSPMQIISISHGKEHLQTYKLLFDIRKSALNFTNAYTLPNLSLGLMNGISNSFADRYIPSFKRIREEEEKTLNDLIKQKQDIDRKAAEQQRQFERKRIEEQRKFERSLVYETQVGHLFKDAFKLSIDGIEWKGQLFPLDNITGVRWGVHVESIKGRIATFAEIHTYIVGFVASKIQVEINPTNRTQ